MKIIPAFITCLVVIASACSTVKKTAAVYSDARINNIAWAVTAFRGKALDPASFPNGMPTVIFNMQDSRINGNDGCNSFMGIAAYTAGTIKSGAIASTKMACPNESFEGDFFETLGSPVISYHLNDGILRLFVNDAEVMALKEKQ